MPKFTVDDRIRVRTDALKERNQGKEGTVMAQSDRTRAGSSVLLAPEDPVYEVQFDEVDEPESLIEESWLEPI